MAKIQGIVKDANEKAIVGALVTFIERGGADKAEARTNAVGRYRTKDLQPGRYEWAAQMQGFNSLKGLVIVKDGDSLVENELIVLVEVGAISGRVFDDAGKPMSGVIVSAGIPDSTDTKAVVTDGNGNYAITNLALSVYVVRAEAPQGFQNPDPVKVEMRSSEPVTVNFRLTRIASLGSISGQVIGEDGAAIPGMLVQADSEQSRITRQAATNQSGEYIFSALPPGQYSIGVRLPAGIESVPESRKVLLEAGGKATGQNFMLIVRPQTGSILGRVTGPSGSAVKDAVVKATNEAGRDVGTATSDANGDYKITGLPAGGYVVSLAPPAGFQAPPPLKVAVNAGAETSNINFQLSAVPQGGMVMGRVTDHDKAGVPGRIVRAMNSDGQSAGQSATMADGRYEIANLAAAVYTVEVVDEPAKPDYLPAFNVAVSARAATTGIDFSEDAIDDLMGRLDDNRFSVEVPISEDEANQAISLFTIVNLMLASLRLRQVGDRSKLDVLAVLNLYYGLQEGSLRNRFVFSDQALLWDKVESELKDLAKVLDRLQSDVAFLNLEARRQFNLGLSNGALGNVAFPALFRRYVEIANSPLLSFDIKAADRNRFFDKTKIAESDQLLKELKSLILALVRSLSKYGTAATKRLNEDWAEFEARALEVLQTIAIERITHDLDEKNVWATLADLTDKTRETEVWPYVALARHGGKLLRYAMEIYREAKDQLDNFDAQHLRDLFQSGSVQSDFWTERIKTEAAVIKSRPLANWL